MGDLWAALRQHAALCACPHKTGAEASEVGFALPGAFVARRGQRRRRAGAHVKRNAK